VNSRIEVVRDALQRLCEQAEAVIDELPDGEYKGLGGLRIMLKNSRELLAEAAPAPDQEVEAAVERIKKSSQRYENYQDIQDVLTVCAAASRRGK
jgi:hypothetical protein